MRLAIFAPFFFDKLIEVSEAIHQLRWHSFERKYQICATTVVDIYILLTFRQTAGPLDGYERARIETFTLLSPRRSLSPGIYYQ